ncbi:MAG: hypothetical protein PQJ59_09835 [Spirochaetales bacterium]|nr:hypothetical protein [Spirochaetales bacterium]
MRQKVYILIFTLVSLAGLFAGGRGESAPDPGRASGEGRSIKVSYRIDKTQADTRSEGRSHILGINGYTLPDVFDMVYAAETPYVFKVKTQAWGDGGYVLDRKGKGNAPYGATDREIDARDWELGWYEGAERKARTPRSWVYVKRDKLEAFVSPDELDRYVAFKQFEVMVRDKS